MGIHRHVPPIRELGQPPDMIEVSMREQNGRGTPGGAFQNVAWRSGAILSGGKRQSCINEHPRNVCGGRAVVKEVKIDDRISSQQTDARCNFQRPPWRSARLRLNRWPSAVFILSSAFSFNSFNSHIFTVPPTVRSEGCNPCNLSISRRTPRGDCLSLGTISGRWAPDLNPAITGPPPADYRLDHRRRALLLGLAEGIRRYASSQLVGGLARLYGGRVEAERASGLDVSRPRSGSVFRQRPKGGGAIRRSDGDEFDALGSDLGADDALAFVRI